MFEVFWLFVAPLPRFLDSKVFYEFIDENEVLELYLFLEMFYETVIKLAGLIVLVLWSNSNIDIFALFFYKPVRL